MIHWLIESSLRHRWLVIGAVFLVFVLGAWCVTHTPIDAIPDVSETQILVYAEWPGHAPQEIQDQITYPLAAQLQGVAGVRTVRTSSDFGYSLIHVIFEDMVDISSARRMVAEQLAGRKSPLPPGVEPQLAPDAPATGQIFWYVLEGDGYDLGRLRDLHDWHVKPQLAACHGVAEVAAVGGFSIEYRVAVDPNRLAANGVTLSALLAEISQTNVRVGGNVLQTPTAEYLIQTTRQQVDGAPDAWQQNLRDLERLVVRSTTGDAVRLADVATVSLGPAPRRGVLEQDGREVVGGVVLMRYGENPVDVIRGIRDKIIRIQPALPPGLRIVTSYDRTPLIYAAVGTLSRALVEAMITATLCVVLVMRHFRASMVISLSLPLAVLASFLGMSVLRSAGMTGVDTNIMSLAGLAISIGVLVDSSVVMTENVMHTLHLRFGDRPVEGDVRPLILPACQNVGRPVFFAMLIMLLSFLPVFALSGLEGKMFRPLALTKSFALLASAALAVTLVPVLCSFLVRGRIRGERDVWLVRSVMDAYRPLLRFLLDRPAAMVWIVAVTFVIGSAPLGNRPQWLGDFLGAWTVLGQRPAMLVALSLSLIAVWSTGSGPWLRLGMFLSLVLIALIAERVITPLGSEFMTPLDEQTVMDMPITVPRASISQSADDLKARDMVLCRFPEAEMVMGKVGRAETPTDPAPVEMIETMVSFRPRAFWPRRKLARPDALHHTESIYRHLIARGIAADSSSGSPTTVVEQATDAVLEKFDGLLREYVYLRNQELLRDIARELSFVVVHECSAQLRRAGTLDQPLTGGAAAAIVASLPTDVTRNLAFRPALERTDEVMRHALAEIHRQQQPAGPAARKPHWTSWLIAHDPLQETHAAVTSRYEALWRNHSRQVNRELAQRGVETFVRATLEDLLGRLRIGEAKAAKEWEQLLAYRSERPKSSTSRSHHGVPMPEPPNIDPLPVLDGLQSELVQRMAPRFSLQRKERTDLVGFGGEMDRALQMPGWVNVWTMPIQNRVDMLATGVNTTVGIRVLGDDLERVVATSERVAEVIRQIPGARDVVADPVRGKGYLTVQVDPGRAAEAGVSMSDVNTVLSVALGGVNSGTLIDGRAHHGIRVVLHADARNDVSAIRRLPIPAGKQVRPTILYQASSTNDASKLPVPVDENRAPLPEPAFHSVTLDQIANVEISEGPATIKGENGLLRNYVRLNVRDRDPLDFVAEAQRIVSEKVPLSAGVILEWTGQFEHQQRARQRLMLVLPAVIFSILIILYWTYHDMADALLMLLAVPGAIAGGLLAQWVLDYKFSVTVWVGYIACFGMATATGIVMLVYLRDAVERAGGLQHITLDELRDAVIAGATQRLRPKLLTEATTIIGLAPVLWATGVGSEVIRPMTAPVLGGILIADEVIDLFLPVMFYWVRRLRWQRIHETGRDAQA